MGRKGGGRKGFIKSVQRSSVEEDDNNEEIQQEVEVAASTSKNTEKEKIISEQNNKQMSSIKEQKVDVTEGGNEEGDDDSVGGEERGEETRGQMLQRHKKELKQLKEQLKRLGKKKKDEANKMEQDLLSTQQKELEELSAKENDNQDATQPIQSEAAFYLKKSDDSQQSKKQSKSQKRRQKQAEQDAEREARIKEEQDNLGTTQKQIENEQLEAVLNPLGLTIYEVKPDGHCMYRALAHQLIDSNYDQLRQQAAEYVRGHKEEFLPFILGEMDENETDNPDEAFTKYCHQLQATAAWGGEVEATAVSHSLKKCIHIHSGDAPTVIIGEEYRSNGGLLHLVFKKYAFGLGEHYDSVTSYSKQEEQDQEQKEEKEADTEEIKDTDN
eukprot:TRINITY_DN21933_c0_g1_i2.p1 TRINITY_DN21933_c0_g1~~TRINITY_DN21933_c0_g1_i2.p1  ORF type:complete len:384 (-),score=93.45 TRINITY_DN21933_c0_g1_i2:294-1445(-)